MRALFFLLTSFLAVNAAPFMDVVHRIPKCNTIMKAHGLSGRFPGAVAHGIHSITLEDLRYYFKKDATEDNGIPTLNYDLTAKNPVLPNAPLYGFDTSFQTVAMRYVDQVLRNMDRKNFYITRYTTLEQLVHTFHMGEVWANAKIHYDKILAERIDDPQLCACVNDLENNGIMKILPFMALKIRYPGITSGRLARYENGTDSSWKGNDYPVYTYYFFNNWSEELAQFDFNQEESVILKQASTQLVDNDKGIQHLTNEKQWKKWKSGMKRMEPRDEYELAMFLYCRLNH